MSTGFQPAVKSLEDIPDATLRAAYVEDADAGEFRFDLSKYESQIKTPLEKKTRELLKEKKDLQQSYARFEKWKELSDDDLAEFQQWREGKANNGEGDDDKPKPETDKELRKLQSQLRTKEQEFTTLKQQHEEATKQLQELATRLQRDEFRKKLRAAAIEAGVEEKDYDDFQDLVEARKHFELDENGRLQIAEANEWDEVLGMSAIDALRGPMSKRYSRFYKAILGSGSGSGDGKGAPRGRVRAEMSDAEKSAYITKYGREAYFKLPAK